MENQDKFSTFDRALLAICLIVVLLCGFLMTHGRFGDEDTSKLSAVGEIQRSENDVRQKHQTGFTWRGARDEDTVFEGDSIFTGDSSKAKVKFAGGGELEIDPKSLVVIRTRNGQLELDLLYGAFSGNLNDGQKITVIKDGERTEVVGNGRPLKVSDAELKKPKAKKLVKGIDLESPNNNSVYWNGAIDYAWSESEDQAPYLLEFSGGPTFKKKIAEFEVAETQFSAKPEFQLYQKANKKEFFWRVRSKAKPTVVSEVRKVTIYKDVPPVLTIPADNHVQFVEPEKTEAAVTLNWTEPSLSQDYNVQVSKDEGFNDLVITQLTENLQFETTSLEQGEYFWRVQGNHPLRSNSPWSETRKFTVIDRSKVSAPSLAATDKVYILPLDKVIKQPKNKKFESLGVPVTDFPNFKWAPVMGASGYGLEVSKDKSFSKFATHNILPPDSQFKFTVMKPGTMAWRVRTLFTSGEPTDPSAVSFVKTELPPPPEKSTESLANNELKVSWSGLIFARHYEVQWATDNEFTSPSSSITSADNLLIKPTVSPQYSLYWRIRALDQQKKPLSSFSEPRTLRAVRKLASNEGADQSITRPIPREPRAQTSVVSFDEAPVFLNFKWTRVPTVSNYRFELSQTPEFTEEPIFSTVINGDQLLINQRLPAGEYYWRIRGENEEGSWTLWSDPAPFNVQFK